MIRCRDCRNKIPITVNIRKSREEIKRLGFTMAEANRTLSLTLRCRKCQDNESRYHIRNLLRN